MQDRRHRRVVRASAICGAARGFGASRAPGAPASARSASLAACRRAGGAARRGEVARAGECPRVGGLAGRGGPLRPSRACTGPGSAARELGRARLRPPCLASRRPQRSPTRPAPAPRSAVAWDTVEELDAARSHAQTAAKADPKASDPLEQFCADGAPRRPLDLALNAIWR